MRVTLAVLSLVLLSGCAHDVGVHGPFLWGQDREAVALEKTGDWISTCTVKGKAPCPPGSLNGASQQPAPARDTVVTTDLPPLKHAGSAW